MMRTLAAIFLGMALIAPAAAQQMDAAALQRLLTVVEAQRNQALAQHAYAEAARAALAEDLAKAQAKLKEPGPTAEPPK